VASSYQLKQKVGPPARVRRTRQQHEELFNESCLGDEAFSMLEIRVSKLF